MAAWPRVRSSFRGTSEQEVEDQRRDEEQDEKGHDDRHYRMTPNHEMLSLNRVAGQELQLVSTSAFVSFPEFPLWKKALALHVPS